MPAVIFPGPEGRLEGRFQPGPRPRAPVAMILHPHPQAGGTMNDRITQFLYKTFVARGFADPESGLDSYYVSVRRDDNWILVPEAKVALAEYIAFPADRERWDRCHKGLLPHKSVSAAKACKSICGRGPRVTNGRGACNGPHGAKHAIAAPLGCRSRAL